MMKVHIRRGTPLDLPGTARLLNDIITAGGTTALTKPMSAQDLGSWLDADADISAWHVAEIDGDIVGFQWVGPYPGLPPEACEIGTFVKIGQTGLGIGSQLFDATKKAARALGYGWIDAEIRADNEGGLIYYQSRGFRRYGVKEGLVLDDGTQVDKVLTRFDLD